MSTERLLREYVRAILNEDDTGAVYADLAAHNASMNPYGVNFGDGDDFSKIFIKPFTDVVVTALGKTKEISQRTQTLVRTVFEAVATTLLPFFKSSYTEIFEKERAQLDKIKQEFGDVYQANWDAFRDNDIFWTAFCYAPHWVLSAKFARHSPRAAIGLLSSLSGGTLDPWLDNIKEKFKYTEPKTGLDFKGVGPGGWYGEGVLREEGEKKPDIGAVLTNKKVLAKVAESPVVKRMQAEARAAVRGSLESVFKEAQAVASARSLEDLQRKTGKRLPGLDKLSQVPAEERQKSEQALLTGLKKSLKEFYVKNLEGQLKQAVGAGVPEGSPYVQDYSRAIAKIKAL